MATTYEQSGEVTYSQQKGEVITQTREITSEQHEYVSASPVLQSSHESLLTHHLQSILPVYIKKEFQCQYPTVDPNVVRVTKPLPFPDNLKDVIAWTDAFVDRIASLTLAQEKVPNQPTDCIVQGY